MSHHLTPTQKPLERVLSKPQPPLERVLSKSLVKPNMARDTSLALDIKSDDLINALTESLSKHGFSRLSRPDTLNYFLTDISFTENNPETKEKISNAVQDYVKKMMISTIQLREKHIQVLLKM